MQIRRAFFYSFIVFPVLKASDNASNTQEHRLVKNLNDLIKYFKFRRKFLLVSHQYYIINFYIITKCKRYFRHTKHFQNMYVLNLEYFYYISFAFASLTYKNYDARYQQKNKKITHVIHSLCYN